MTARAGRRAVRSVALAAVLVVVGAGCSNDDTLPTVAERPTTTDPAAAADLEPAAPPRSAQVIVGDLEAAVAARDVCAVLDAIDDAEPDPDDRAGDISVYRALSAATKASRAFVPAQLRSDWEVIVAGTELASKALDDHDGDLTDPEVEAALTSTDMVDAIRNVERYQFTACPPPTGA